MDNMVRMRAQISLLANSASLGDINRDHFIHSFVVMDGESWVDIKKWSEQLPDRNYYNNIQDMCNKLQMIRDLQD